MLVKTPSAPKSNRWWVAVLGLIFILGGVGLFLYFPFPKTQITYLSPLFGTPKPDLSAPLKTKASLLPPLDYSQSLTLPTLADNLSYLVYHPITYKVYAAQNQTQYLSPASFTKLLTTQIALDLFPTSQLFTATQTSIDKEPTILGLKVGEQLTLDELIRGAISTSANDAAATIGEGIARYYSQDHSYFSELMNQKALLLGMGHSHFANPEGYDDNAQYTTLEDIAKLVHNTQNYPEIISAGLLDRHDLTTTPTHGFYYLPNWNGLLGVYPGVTGLKIAYTDRAGYSTIVTCQRNNIPVVVILTGADSIPERDLAAAALLDAAYIANKLKPINLTKSKLLPRYQEWADLSAKIKAETLTKAL